MACTARWSSITFSDIGAAPIAPPSMGATAVIGT